MATTVYEPLIDSTLAMRDLSTFDEAKLQQLVVELSVLPEEFLQNEVTLNRFHIRLAERKGKSPLRLKIMGEIYSFALTYKEKKELPVMDYTLHEMIHTHVKGDK